MKKLATVLSVALLCSVVLPLNSFAFNFNSEKTVALTGDVNNVVPYTTRLVDNGRGEWRYGTGIGFKGGEIVKTAYSYMDHSSKDHRTSCQIDTNYVDSGWYPPRSTSPSDTFGPRKSTAYCNWEIK